MGLTHRRNCDFLVFWQAKTRTSGRAAGARKSRLDPFLSHVVSSCGPRLCSRPSRTYLNAFASFLISIDNISKFNKWIVCALMNRIHTRTDPLHEIFQTVDTTRASKVVQRNKMLNQTTYVNKKNQCFWFSVHELKQMSIKHSFKWPCWITCVYHVEPRQFPSPNTIG